MLPDVREIDIGGIVSEYERIVAAYDSNPKCHNYDFSVARARIAELEAHLESARAAGMHQCDVRKQAEAALAERDQMLETAEKRLSNVAVRTACRLDAWSQSICADVNETLAALRARAEEGRTP